MYINDKKLRKLFKKNGLALKDLLAKSGVSKTAYYNLLYKDTVLPKSIHAFASVLGVKPSAFLEEVNLEKEKIIRIAEMTDEIIEEFSELDRDNVRHTLLLLQEKPVERLRRGLKRGRKFNIY